MKLARIAVGCVYLACTEPAHPPPETRPIERSIVRAGIALNRVCPEENCGVVRVKEDTTVRFAEISCFEKYFSVIRFNRANVKSAQTEYGEDAALGIFAHEMGHHLDAILNGLVDEKPWIREYHADRWAGCMIATIDANPKPLEAFLRSATAVMTESHPPGNARADEMLEGFKACSAD